MKERIIAMVCLVAFAVTIVGLSQVVDAASNESSDVYDSYWTGDKPYEVDGKIMFHYSEASANGMVLKYQTRFIADQKVISLPQDLNSMSVRILLEDENGLHETADTRYVVTNIQIYSPFGPIDMSKIQPSQHSNETVSFAATVVMSDDDGVYSGTAFVNMVSYIVADRYDLGTYLTVKENATWTYNWNVQSIESGIDSKSPGTNKDGKAIDGPVLGVDYYWVQATIYDPVATDVGNYKAVAVAIDSSSLYKGNTGPLNWAIDAKGVSGFEYDSLTYNGEDQFPDVQNLTVTVKKYKVNVDNSSFEYGKVSELKKVKVILEKTVDFEIDVNSQKNAGTYSGDDGYVVVFKGKSVGNVYTENPNEWTIEKDEISYDMAVLYDDATGFVYVVDEDSHYGDYIYTGDPQGPPGVRICDRYTGELFDEAWFSISGDGEQVGPGDDYSLMVSLEDVCPNFTGNLDFVWKISTPQVLAGEVHVNLIYTDGTLTSDMFTKYNTFIYPYSSTYSMYDDEGNYNEGGSPLNIERNQYKIVVLDANGNIVINEMDDSNNPIRPGSGKTLSEWNHIELYGTNGFKGCITGSFYVSFVYDVGSSFIVNGVDYTVTSTKKMTVSVTGYESDVPAALEIPDKVNGFKVTKIEDKAFYGCKTLTSVDIGDNVTAVGMKAFANCSNLKSVVFGSSVKVISSYAFYGCKNLEEVDFDSSLTTVRKAAFSVTFQDASGKKMDATAKNLAGHTFEGSKKVLKLVA